MIPYLSLLPSLSLPSLSPYPLYLYCSLSHTSFSFLPSFPFSLWSPPSLHSPSLPPRSLFLPPYTSPLFLPSLPSSPSLSPSLRSPSLPPSSPSLYFPSLSPFPPSLSNNPAMQDVFVTTLTDSLNKLSQEVQAKLWEKVNEREFLNATT